MDLCLTLDGTELDEKDRQLIDSILEEILNLTYKIKEALKNE